jgi:DNA-binding response OmpR family regulator
MSLAALDRRDPLHAEIAALRALVDTQAETIRQLKETLAGCPKVYPAAWEIRGQQRRLLQMLHTTKLPLLSQEKLYVALYEGREVEIDIKIVDQQIFRLRRKLRPHGVEIINEWGQGFYIPSEGKARLDIACEAQS